MNEEVEEERIINLLGTTSSGYVIDIDVLLRMVSSAVCMVSLAISCRIECKCYLRAKSCSET